MNGKKTTCATVNKLLKENGITNIKMYRDNQGGDYYYFICESAPYVQIESIMQYSIADDDPMEYVRMVMDAIGQKLSIKTEQVKVNS